VRRCLININMLAVINVYWFCACKTIEIIFHLTFLYRFPIIIAYADKYFYILECKGENMEKTTNSYYKAVSILCYIFGGLSIAGGILFIVWGSLSFNSNSLLFQDIYNDALVDYAGDVQTALEFTRAVIRMIIVMGALIVASSPVMFVEGVVFGKLVELTDKEADEKYSKALAWSIVSFFFGGLLIGGLAIGGLMSTQNFQRVRYLATKDMPVIVEPEQNANKPISLEKIDRVNERLHKLDELKKSGALTEEEYTRLRAEIVGTLIPKEKNEEEKVAVAQEEKESAEEKINKRVEKLEKLKESGAISEEEFEVLKSKIQNENK